MYKDIGINRARSSVRGELGTQQKTADSEKKQLHCEIKTRKLFFNSRILRELYVKHQQLKESSLAKSTKMLVKKIC